MSNDDVKVLATWENYISLDAGQIVEEIIQIVQENLKSDMLIFNLSDSIKHLIASWIKDDDRFLLSRYIDPVFKHRNNSMISFSFLNAYFDYATIYQNSRPRLLKKGTDLVLYERAHQNVIDAVLKMRLTKKGKEHRQRTREIKRKKFLLKVKGLSPE